MLSGKHYIEVTSENTRGSDVDGAGVLYRKVISCLGIDYYASHQTIGLTAAMLLEHRCGSNPSADGYKACRDALLREVVAAYQRMASDPRW